MRASCASAAQQMMTMRARSTPPGSLRMKPVTVISRLFNDPELSLAARITTSGTETSGARPAGSGGNSMRTALLDPFATDPVAAPGRNAGGVTKISTTTGTADHPHTPAGVAVSVAAFLFVGPRPAATNIPGDRHQRETDQQHGGQ